MPYSDYLSNIYPEDGTVDAKGNVIIKPKVALPDVKIPSPVVPPAVANQVRGGGVNIPPPGPVESQMTQLATNAPVNNPSLMRKIAAYGIGALGGATGHPTAGVDTYNAPYNQQMSQWQQKIAALGRPAQMEQERTGLGVKAASEQERTAHDLATEAQAKTLGDLKAKAEEDKVANQKQVEDLKRSIGEATIKWHEGELNDREHRTEITALKTRLDDLNKKMEESGRNVRADKHEAAATGRAEIMASAPGKRPTPSAEESGAIAANVDTFTKANPDPSKVNSNSEEYRTYIDGLDPKVREGVEASLYQKGYPTPTLGKLPVNMVTQSIQAKRSIETVHEARQTIDQLVNKGKKLGPFEGRIDQGKLVLGSNDPEVQPILRKLNTELNQISIAEAASLGRYGAPANLIKIISVGTGRVSMGVPELKATLDATEQFMKKRQLTPTSGPDATASGSGITVKVIK